MKIKIPDCSITGKGGCLYIVWYDGSGSLYAADSEEEVEEIIEEEEGNLDECGIEFIGDIAW